MGPSPLEGRGPKKSLFEPIWGLSASKPQNKNFVKKKFTEFSAFMLLLSSYKKIRKSQCINFLKKLSLKNHF